MVLKSKLRIILSKIFLGYEILEILITTDAQHSTCPSCNLLQQIAGILSYPYKTAKSLIYTTSPIYINGKKMKAKLDAESRLVIPGNIRDELNITAKEEEVLEKIADKEIDLKPLSPEEFLKEAHNLADDIRRTKIREIDPLKVKKMWEG